MPTSTDASERSPRVRGSGRSRLWVEPCPSPDADALLRFALRSPRPADAGCGLEWLGGNLAQECWLTGEAVRDGESRGIRWRQSGDLLLLALEQPEDPAGDPAPVMEDAYDRLLALAIERGCPRPVRAWNYLPAINDGDGDAERYRRFCVGRAAALKKAGHEQGEVCAGTAIGGEEQRLRVYLLCAPHPGVNIENPRQVSAYRYPRRYGPNSPSFARATALAGPDRSVLLMISGTASIVGHRSVHSGDVDAQLGEIMRNLETLLAESAETLCAPGLVDFGAHSLLRVYLRHAADWPAIERRLRGRWPDAHLAGLRGDICRSDLLVEIEAVTRGTSVAV